MPSVITPAQSHTPSTRAGAVGLPADTPGVARDVYLANFIGTDAVAGYVCARRYCMTSRWLVSQFWCEMFIVLLFSRHRYYYYHPRRNYVCARFRHFHVQVHFAEASGCATWPSRSVNIKSQTMFIQWEMYWSHQSLA